MFQVTQCNGRYHLSGDDESGSSVQVFSSWSRAGAVLESPPLEATTHLVGHSFTSQATVLLFSQVAIFVYLVNNTDLAKVIFSLVARRCTWCQATTKQLLDKCGSSCRCCGAVSRG